MSIQDWQPVPGQEPETGNQGSILAVEHRLTKVRGARKVLHAEHLASRERRFRMQQEVNALKLLAGSPGIPRVLDDNGALWESKDIQLFAVLEWINGPTLARFVTGNARSLEESLAVTIALLNIVSRCHEADIHHRDIKPDNIILRSGDLSSPCLVDFGMAWSRAEDRGFKTEGQELGNRFLRLPEFAVGDDRRDPRSDVTLCAGILFYLLTGKAPRQLRDAEGRRPHESIPMPPTITGDPRWTKLRRVLNVAFEQSIDMRYRSCLELSEALSHLSPGDEPERRSQRAYQHVQSVLEQTNIGRLDRLKNGASEAARVFERALDAHLEGMEFSVGGSGGLDLTGATYRAEYFLVRKGTSDPQVPFGLTVSFGGDLYVALVRVGKSRVQRSLYKGPLADQESLNEALINLADPLLAELLRLYADEVSDRVASPATRGERVTKDAANIAEHFVRTSNLGLGGESTAEVAVLARVLGKSTDEIRRAAAELEERNLVQTRATIGSSAIAPLAEIFVRFDKYWKPWNSEDDAVALATLIANHEAGFNAQDLETKLNWPTRRLNPALYFLFSRGYVDASNEMSFPYAAFSVRPNSRTRLYLDGAI